MLWGQAGADGGAQHGEGGGDAGVVVGEPDEGEMGEEGRVRVSSSALPFVCAAPRAVVVGGGRGAEEERAARVGECLEGGVDGVVGLGLGVGGGIGGVELGEVGDESLCMCLIWGGVMVCVLSRRYESSSLLLLSSPPQKLHVHN